MEPTVGAERRAMAQSGNKAAVVPDFARLHPGYGFFDDNFSRRTPMDAPASPSVV
jgi:hypothetical protein